jgi:hypothetical protein
MPRGETTHRPQSILRRPPTRREDRTEPEHEPARLRGFAAGFAAIVAPQPS